MIVEGVPFVEIVKIAKDLEADLLLMGSHAAAGARLDELLFGSTAEKVLRACSVPGAVRAVETRHAVEIGQPPTATTSVRSQSLLEEGRRNA